MNTETLFNPLPSGSKITGYTSFVCNDCGCKKPIKHDGGTGFAEWDGKLVCYDCADIRQREELKDRSKPFTGYLGERNVTTWTGGELMRVTRETDWKIFGSHFHRGSCVHAIDCHGKHWYGRGAGRGMCITLRPCKP